MVKKSEVKTCFFLKWPTSCANTATSSSSECFSIKVSYNAMVILGPSPLKNALAFEDLLDPSIMYIFFKE